MFVNTVGYNESIPQMVTKWSDNRESDHKLCSDMLTNLHGEAEQHWRIHSNDKES